MRTSHFASATIQYRLQFIDKIVNVLEFTIDGRKTHKRDFVQISQSAEDEFANAARRNFTLTIFVQRCFDIADQEIDLFRTDGTFVARHFDTAANFYAVKWNSRTIFLDDSDWRLFNFFIRRETTLAT